jgi:tetratricopeptide (TPR) repeat protein
MSQQKYPKAYEAYQQAVYRDGKNPTFWCSIGVLYYQINQYRDALDAYSRAIRLNPYISEVWYDLGTLVRSVFHRCDFSLHGRRVANTVSSTNLATTRSPTPSTPTKGQQSWIQATRTSRLASSFSGLAAPMAAPRLQLLSLLICIHRHTRQALRVLLNGEGLRSSSLLAPLLPLRRLARAGRAGCRM